MAQESAEVDARAPDASRHSVASLQDQSRVQTPTRAQREEERRAAQVKLAGSKLVVVSDGSVCPVSNSPIAEHCTY